MKKRSVLLSVTMLMGALTACGSKDENAAGVSESASQSASASADAQKPVKLKIFKIRYSPAK